VNLETEESFDPDARQLCPDGNCTGVLDDEGVCKLCGTRGTPAVRVAAAEAMGDGAASEIGGALAAEVGLAAASATTTAEPSDDPEFDARQLCPDGNCLGLLGADGRCKVCGRSPG
jgi:hypothetical protein